MRTTCTLSMIAFLAATLLAAAADDKKDVNQAAPPPTTKSASRPPGKEPAKPGAKVKKPGSEVPVTKTEDGKKEEKEDEGETPTVAGDLETPSEQASKYPDEEAQLLKSAEAFVKAYAKRDAKALAALYAPDAEYVDALGEVFQGRDAIETTFADFFTQNPECRLMLDIASIRFLSPTLAIEDGTTFCTFEQDGRPVDGRYTAIHSKIDGEWLMASVRERGSSNPRQHARRLKQLDWLIGNWVDEDDDSIVHFDCRPNDNGNFLLRDFDVAVAGDSVIKGTQRIGWDPVSGKFRTWTFDSEGGYFDGYLSRDGDRWILSSSGVTADGHSASGKAIFTPVNGHTITWQMIDREINGTPIEDSDEFTLVKKGPQPEGHAGNGKDTTEKVTKPILPPAVGLKK